LLDVICMPCRGFDGGYRRGWTLLVTVCGIVGILVVPVVSDLIVTLAVPVVSGLVRTLAVPVVFGLIVTLAVPFLVGVDVGGVRLAIQGSIKVLVVWRSGIATNKGHSIFCTTRIIRSSKSSSSRFTTFPTTIDLRNANACTTTVPRVIKYTRNHASTAIDLRVVNK